MTVEPWIGCVSIVELEEIEVVEREGCSRADGPFELRGAKVTFAFFDERTADPMDSLERREAQRRAARERVQARVRGEQPKAASSADRWVARPALRDGLRRALVVEVGPFVPVLEAGDVVWFSGGFHSSVLEVGDARLLSMHAIVGWERGE